MRIFTLVCVFISLFKMQQLDAAFNCDSNFKEMSELDALLGIESTTNAYIRRNDNAYACAFYYISLLSKIGVGEEDINQLYNLAIKNSKKNDPKFINTKNKSKFRLFG